MTEASMHSRYALVNVVSAAIVIAVALFWARNQLDPSPYGYDEADYAFAASRGFVDNWSDTPSISLLEFVRIGLARGRDRSQRSDLSTTLRESGDIHGYRHWHGPLYFYLLRLAEAAAHDEHGVRAICLAGTFAGVAVIYFGCWWLWPGLQGSLSAFLGSLLFLWNSATVLTTELAPHLLFSMLTIASVFAVAKMIETGRRAHWYAAVALAGFAFSTMELAFALAIALVIFAYLERARLHVDGGFITRSLAAFLAPVAIVWPAALYKLSFIKSYLVMAYLAVFRKGAWGDVTFAETWKNRLSAMPVEWAALILAIAIVTLRSAKGAARTAGQGGHNNPPRSVLREFPAKDWRAMSAFLLYGLLMTVAILRVNAPGPRYVTPFYPPLAVFTGCALAAALIDFRPLARTAMVALIALAVFFDTARQVPRQPRQPNPPDVALLAQVRNRHWETKHLLVPQIDVPTLHYYFPGARLRGYVDPSEIDVLLARDHFDGVIYPDGPPNAAPR